VWVLVSGLLRYVYTLTLAVFPPPGGPAPRSRFARSSFGLFVTSRIAALALPAAVAVPVAGLGSLLLWFSFARSFFYAYARPGVAPGEGAPIVDEALARDDAAPSDPRAWGSAAIRARDGARSRTGHPRRARSGALWDGAPARDRRSPEAGSPRDRCRETPVRS